MSPVPDTHTHMQPVDHVEAHIANRHRHPRPTHILAKTTPSTPSSCTQREKEDSTGPPNFPQLSVFTMCDFTKNYYIYTSCVDPGAHFFRTSVDGSRKRSCPKSPHERFIMLPGECPICHGG